jgi:hypothetical protein
MIFALGLLLALPAVLQAEFRYTTNNGTITITGYTSADSKYAVTIPNTINGLLVTSIGDSAFTWLSGLTNITIPNSITNIGNGAFGVCEALTAITVDALNSYYSSVDGILFDKNLTTLIQFPGGRTGSYVVADNVRIIEELAFARSRLPSISTGNGVTTIGLQAFVGCSNLTNVVIGNSVTNIDVGAFASCRGLTTVDIPSNVTRIGDGAFDSCTSLTSVQIATGVTTIDSEAFVGCSALSDILIPQSVVSIGDNAFIECSDLHAIRVNPMSAAYSSMDGVLFNSSQTTLIRYPGGKAGSYTIPSSVTSICENAFSYCDKLASIVIPNTVGSISRFTFFSCSGLTNVTIPNSLTSIGELAFYDCFSLTNVTIPKNVTSLGYLAFYFCSNLTAVYFQGDPPSADEDFVFQHDDNLTIYYLPGTAGWGTTFGKRPTALWSLPYPEVQDMNPNFPVRTKGFGFAISWATNASVVVEASANFANSAWTPVSTNTLVGGMSHFSDLQWTNYPVRFYRLRAL